MSVRAEPFGTLADGRVARSVQLSWPGGLEVEILDYGAIVRCLRAPAPKGLVETVLGFASLSEYEADRGYQGCVVGRFANRIAGARFSIDGEDFTVSANEGGNTLHGGRVGFGKRLWRFVEVAEDGLSCCLAYDSADGEEGFPGTVRAQVEFVLNAPDTLTIVWRAETDRPTPVNLTHHLYFNLTGDASCPVLDHSLTIAADAITPVRRDLIPTGAFMAVGGTAFDLRQSRPLAEVLGRTDPQLALGGGVDHNWALEPGAAPAARLRSLETGLSLLLSTDQPGLQVYSGQGLGGPFAPYGGVALEPQGFPNAVNQPGFPDAVLRPGAVYRRSATYRFVTDAVGEGP